MFFGVIPCNRSQDMSVTKIVEKKKKKKKTLITVSPYYRTKLKTVLNGQWPIETHFLLATFFFLKLEMINTKVCFKNFCMD